MVDYRKRTVRQYVLFKLALLGSQDLAGSTVIFHTWCDGEHISCMPGDKFVQLYGSRLMGSYLADDFLLEDGFRCSRNCILNVLLIEE